MSRTADTATNQPLHACRRRTPRPVHLAGVLGVVMLLQFCAYSRVVVINTSPSLASGLYVITTTHPAVGSLVEFETPAAMCAYWDANDEAHPYRYVLKPIIAGPGDHVDTTGDGLCINGQFIAPIATHDSAGHALPHWRDNRVLAEDEFFVFSGRAWNSFDSRYFGPIRRADIVAVRVPLLVWE